jgi:adenylate kinase family enzyme
VLSAQDVLDPAPCRILVAGVSGSGKTTLALRIAAATGIPHTEIDGLAHGIGWERRPTFAKEVAQFTRADRWITEWQYSEVRELLAERADTLIWLDVPTALTMSRVTRRTLRRRLGRQPLWNGNVEPPLRTIFTDRDHIIRWAWRTRHLTRELVLAAATDHPHLRLVRLTSRRDVDKWLHSRF